MRAVAVIQACPAVATACAHTPFIAPAAAKIGLPRPQCTGFSGPAQFFQPVVVDAEMVRDFMDYGDRHLFDDLVFGIADVQQRFAVDRDGVRQRPPRSRSPARSAPRLRTARAGRLPPGGGRRPARRRCPSRPPASGGIRSSASETSSSNRCGSIRTAMARSRGGLGPARPGGGAPPSAGGGGAPAVRRCGACGAGGGGRPATPETAAAVHRRLVCGRC